MVKTGCNNVLLPTLFIVIQFFQIFTRHQNKRPWIITSEDMMYVKVLCIYCTANSVKVVLEEYHDLIII